MGTKLTKHADTHHQANMCCETLLGNLENNSQALNLTNDQHNCNQKSARMLSKQQYASHKS